MPDLAVDGVTVRFGGLEVLSDVGLQVASGRVHGLIGPNGAGKTTLFDVITGLVRPTHGRVLLDGRDIGDTRPHLRARLGLARTFQHIEICGTLTVRENVQLAVEASRGRARHETPSTAVADALLASVGVADIADVPADRLPTGYARLVEIARALATGPSVLLLDEPSSGLDSVETASLGRILRRLAAEGMGVLLIEHDMGLVMDVSDDLTVLDGGRVIAVGAPGVVRADARVQQAYLGVPAARRAPAAGAAPGRRTPAASGGGVLQGALSAVFTPSTGDPVAAAGRAGPPASAWGVGTKEPCSPATDGTDRAPGAPGSASSPVILALQDIRAAYGRIEVVHGVTLALRRGAVFALLGPNGAGKSTVLKLCSGRLAPTGGTVSVGGKVLSGVRPDQLARRGVCAIPERRAIFPNLTVADNLRMATYRARWLRDSDVQERAYAWFPRLCDRRHQLAGTLSGGEQQMLALGRALATDPEILLLDELSMGLAPQLVEQLYEVLGARAVRGLTILMVEQFATTALALATEVAVMVNGRIAHQGAPADVARYVTSAYLGEGEASRRLGA